jgi:hypothetical protein
MIGKAANSIESAIESNSEGTNIYVPEGININVIGEVIRWGRRVSDYGLVEAAPPLNQ